MHDYYNTELEKKQDFSQTLSYYGIEDFLEKFVKKLRKKEGKKCF